MDEHDDDLESEVVEGEEIESDSFDVDEEADVRNVEDAEDGEDGDASAEDESEI